MAYKEPTCPTCDGDLHLDGTEKAGERVFCPCCGAPSVLLKDAKSEECLLEEDY